MYRPTLCLLLAISLHVIHLPAQDITLQGQISIHNSKYRTGQTEYVSNASISGDFASSAASDRLGLFRLLFRGIAQGTAVELQVEKDSLEVVNAHELEQVVIPRKHPLPVFMAKKGQLTQAQLELHDINVEAIKQRYESYISRLRTAHETVLKELEENLGRKIADRWEAEKLLGEQLEATLKRLPKIARQMARVNLDLASRQYQQAYEAFSRGEVDSVISLLSDISLDAQNHMANMSSARRMRSELDRTIAYQENIIRQKLDGIELKTQAHTLLFQYKQASEVYLMKVAILEKWKPGQLEVAEAYDRLYGIYQSMGAYESGREIQKKAIDIKLRITPPPPNSLANSFNRLAIAFRFLGKYDSAYIYQKKAIGLKKSHYGPMSQDLANSYGNLAVNFHHLGELDSAKLYQWQALQIKKKATDSALIAELAYHYDIYARILSSQGLKDSAVLYQQKTIDIFEQNRAIHLADLAIAYGNMSMILDGMGKSDSALHIAKTSLSIEEKIYEPMHPELASAYDGICIIFASIGRFDSALVYGKKGLTIREKAFGTYHPGTAYSYSNLSVTYYQLGLTDSSIIAAQTSIDIRERIYPSSHPSIGDSYNNLAAFQKIAGKYESALASQWKATRIYESVYEPNHPNVATVYGNLSSVYKTIGLLDSSIFFLRISIHKKNQIYPPNHLSFGVAYSNLSSVFVALGMLDSALLYQQQALKIRMAGLSPIHPSIANSFVTLSSIYQSQGILDSALLYEYKGLKIYESIYPARHRLFGDSYKSMASIYYDMGLYDSSSHYIQQALSIREDFDQGQTSLERAIILFHLGKVESKFDRWNRSQQLLEQAFEMSREFLPIEDGRVQQIGLALHACYVTRFQQEKTQGNRMEAKTIKKKRKSIKRTITTKK